MKVELNAGWTVERAGEEPTPVTLPHDAMIHERRDRKAPAGPASGFYPGGAYIYRTTITAPAEWSDKHVSVVFEGAQRNSTVHLNGHVVGGRPSGYAEFSVDLDKHLRFSEDNDLEVVVDNSLQPNTRWYSGSGLYRRVWLQVEGTTRFAEDGIRFRTVSAGIPARAEVEITALDDAGLPFAVEVELRAGEMTVARGGAEASSNDPVVVAIDVESPKLWSAEHPHLYDLVIRATRDGSTLAEHRERVGIRIVTADARRGLLVNGVSTLLRGGCLHHDNGVLGAATFRDAEFRRVRILKEVGFNAIRAGHTPLSRDVLDACDELGMFVMDELTDVWFKPKGQFDSGRDFRTWWRRDLESMIAKDRNHASVILYSIGNENGETATEEGIAVGREMVAACHDLDPTRLVTAGVNPFLNALASAGIGLLNMGGDEDQDPSTIEVKTVNDAPKLASSTLINQLMNVLNERILSYPRLPRFDSSTKGIFAELDVAGYNYGVGQYELHSQRYPDRVMVGTETNPKDVVRNWNLVRKHPYLIGDFMWTGWDYLGEAGIGSYTYGKDRVGLIKPFPWLTADCGAVDLIGNVTAAGLLAQAAWGRTEPAIVSRPPQYVGLKKVPTNWRGTDAIATWSWTGYEGKPTEVLVYSAAESVELFVNGRSLGRRPAGAEHGCTAVFPVTYEPGELVAVAYEGHFEVGRTVLRSAGSGIRLRLSTDREELQGGEQDLAFVRVQLTDDDGIVVPWSGVALTATVSGVGSLAGFGSADPKPAYGFVSGFNATFHGEALAVVRAGVDAGEVTLTVASDGFGEETITLAVDSPSAQRSRPHALTSISEP
ncbi:glycoside hydrolase family 2 TIM barrel-domain containing protein [Microbacterium sp. ARD31]|uniref:glycoside hydrolase family 2 TIM barrel-domain containing protein n=1 Tax=Microbacterium sp. ARD31 TaxID=2962576 RepID=UPI002882B9F1|nr:glycoside hydrolase family 2 TIM barrel-domain containing protein [Microbacterium sp. ARD31]MDT0184023.1 glycoside hydrolase family 2 TIM barrel-domain containing protein [Microbacterium sp. ARD31]